MRLGTHRFRAATGLRALLTTTLVLAACSYCVAQEDAEPYAPDVPREQAHVNDPLESFNRKMFAFNEGFDEYVFEPVASAWDTIAPRPVQRAIDNFFDNVRFPVRFVNHLLQGEVDSAAITLGRFCVNTTLGIAGFFDPASDMKLENRGADFGQTLGRYGVPPGPYLVWPVWGPSNPRDTTGLVVDSYIDVTTLFIDLPILIGARAVQAVNTRSLFLEEVNRARESSFDLYVAMRDAYLQRREEFIHGEAARAARDQQLYFPDSDEEVSP
jgi:phospholipid-binding lipoprotein MlaA